MLNFFASFHFIGVQRNLRSGVIKISPMGRGHTIWMSFGFLVRVHV